MLRASIPRNLRVQPSIQLASTRVPARAFLMAAGLIFAGGLTVVAGADVVRTVKLISAAIVVGLAVFELRCWGRSSREVVRIVWRHHRRARRLVYEPELILLLEEVRNAGGARRPRWRLQD